MGERLALLPQPRPIAGIIPAFVVIATQNRITTAQLTNTKPRRLAQMLSEKTPSDPPTEGPTP